MRRPARWVDRRTSLYSMQPRHRLPHDDRERHRHTLRRIHAVPGQAARARLRLPQYVGRHLAPRPGVSRMTVTALDTRREIHIGGSKAASACGIDPYRSRRLLWYEMVNGIEREKSEAMRLGTLLQPAIAEI